MKKRGRKRTIEEKNPWKNLPLYTEEDNEALWRIHCGKSHRYSLDNYCAWYQHGKLGLLTKAAQLDAWKQTEKFIGYKTKNHFKKLQFNQEYQVDRILAYYEWARLHWFQNPPWIRFAFERNFPQIEAVLQCRRLGISLPNGSCLLNCKTKFIKYFIIYFICKRQGVTYEDYFIALNGAKEMYDDIQLEYEFYLASVESVLASASYYSSCGFLGSHELGISLPDTPLLEVDESTRLDSPEDSGK